MVRLRDGVLWLVTYLRRVYTTKEQKLQMKKVPKTSTKNNNKSATKENNDNKPYKLQTFISKEQIFTSYGYPCQFTHAC